MLFDAYGTLFDVYSVALLAEELFPGHGQALSVLWRDKQIEYTRLVTTWYGYQTLWVNRYQLPFEELGTQPTCTGSSLRDVLAFFPAKQKQK